jgi:membrane protease YdiL (CAAX protease family)
VSHWRLPFVYLSAFKSRKHARSRYKFCMPPDSIVISDAAPAMAQLEIDAEKRRRWFELFLVLLVAFGAPFINSLAVLRTGPSATSYISGSRWLGAMVQEVAALLVLGYVLSRRNLSFRDIGLRWSMREVGAGLLVTVVAYLMYAVGSLLIHFLPIHMSSANARSFYVSPSAMIIPFSLLNPFFEELIVRAYLMTEIMNLTGSYALAIVASLGVQCSAPL